MEQIVNLREINQYLSRYISSVEAGHFVIITKRGRPVAKLVPVERERRLSKAQKEARKRTLARMKKGCSLGGERFERYTLYDR